MKQAAREPVMRYSDSCHGLEESDASIDRVHSFAHHITNTSLVGDEIVRGCRLLVSNSAVHSLSGMRHTAYCLLNLSCNLIIFQTLLMSGDKVIGGGGGWRQ